jgi:hypothetical protein
LSGRDKSVCFSLLFIFGTVIEFRVLRRSTQYRFDGLKQPGDPARSLQGSRRDERHTFGSIVWLAMLRLTATIFVAWYLKDHFINYGEWWMVTVAAIYGIAIYPAQLQYHYFRKTSRRLMEQTLCSSCRYFNAEGLHCTKLDEHISEHYLPCEGEGWEPKSFEDL